MKTRLARPLGLAVALTFALGACASNLGGRPAPSPHATLSSWQPGATRAALEGFVARVSDPESPDFVPASERVAVFDNDGTLWAEQPAYFQLLFAVDRVRAMALDHPEWNNQQPYQAVLEGDMEALAASGHEGLKTLLAVSHVGMTTGEFEAQVRAWVEDARHPTSGRPYTAMVYQPMLELLEYLRAHGFKTFIVSGGGIDFMRVFTEEVYGIPPEQVVGTSIELRYEERDGEPVLVRLPELSLLDDKAGKPVGIQRYIGRRPILAFGNSDGDFEMLKWTAAGDGARLCGLVRHTDAVREWAYDRQSKIGRLDAALDAAVEREWLVVDMAQDWSAVFPSNDAGTHD